MPVTSYSTTPANNGVNGFAEGQSPPSLNDGIRQVLTDIAVEAQTNAVKVLGSVAGTNTITGSMSPALTAYSAGMLVVLTPANTTTGAATLNIDTLGALDVFRYGGEALQAGDLVSGVPAYLLLDSGADDFYLLNPQNTGFRNAPQNSQSGDYTLVLADAGKSVYSTGASKTITIPANGTVAYPIGTVIVIIANGTAGSRTISSTAPDTLYLAGVGTTGSRTLAPYGVCSIVKVSSTEWFISGTGLS